MPWPLSWVRIISAMSFLLVPTACDLFIAFLSALQGQLVASHQEIEEAHLREVLLMEDPE